MSDEARHVIVASILEPGAPEVLERLRAVPPECIVELRADRLRAQDLPGLIRAADRPVIVTVRRRRDGGGFDGSEAERRTALEIALESGASWVDVEWSSALADIAESLDRERVILSHHGSPCVETELAGLYRAMRATGAGRIKLVPRAERISELRAVRRTLLDAASDGGRLACFATGRAGTVSRILAPAWGSWATYGFVSGARATAEGQLPAEDLLDVHRVGEIGEGTRFRALVGSDLTRSPSPAMHNAAYRAAGIDARYLPVELDSFDDIVPLTAVDGCPALEALAVTLPFKQSAAARAEPADRVSALARSVNTVRIEDGRWLGYNTDGPAARALLERRLDLRGAVVACVGAGGTARAIAAALRSAGAEVTIFNRDPSRGRSAARELGASARPLSELPSATWDVLVQATPLGRACEEVLAPSCLRGCAVLDVVYGPRPTPLITEARSRGVVAIEGFELLVEQAVRQFRVMCGIDPDRETMERAGRRWIESWRRLADA